MSHKPDVGEVARACRLAQHHASGCRGHRVGALAGWEIRGAGDLPICQQIELRLTVESPERMWIPEQGDPKVKRDQVANAVPGAVKPT